MLVPGGVCCCPFLGSGSIVYSLLMLPLWFVGVLCLFILSLCLSILHTSRWRIHSLLALHSFLLGVICGCNCYSPPSHVAVGWYAVFCSW